jgi:serine/threonine protein kinase
MMFTEDSLVSQTPAPLANGRYTLENTLGQGGMATVYGGFDTMLEVDRAVKVLSPALCRSEKLRSRFLAEARAMAKLRHTNIVTVFDVGVEGDTPFIVMEMVKGGAVIDLMDREGPQPPDIAGPIMLGALAGVQASHDRGVVHRDIKPHNMLLTLDGIVKITDFGIAHMQEDERSFTKTGAVMGTLAYMPPEQRQNAKGLGPTADIFAAGASLYALLTGKEPFDLYNEALYAKLFEGVPEALSQIVGKACSYEPDSRYRSASEMSLALYEALRSLGVEIAPDYRVKMSSNPEGTVFFDGGGSASQGAPSSAPVVDNTTINPKETWFTTSGERISDDPTFATMNPAERPGRKFGLVGILLVVGVVGAVAVNSLVLDGEPELTPPPEIQNAAAALQDARRLVEDAPEAVEEVKEEPAAESPEEIVPPVVAAPVAPVVRSAKRPERVVPRRVAAPSPPPALEPEPPAPEPTPAVTPAVAPVAAPPPEVAIGPTKLSISSMPRSSVTIDGRGYGQTWVRNVELTPGAHRVVWQLADGTPPKSMTVSLEPGENRVVCWSFTLGAICPR